MRVIFKTALGVFGRTVLITVLSLFITMSVGSLITNVFTEEIGYRVYNQKTGEFLYAHYEEDGDDTKINEYKEKDIDLKSVGVRSELEGFPKFLYYFSVQALSFMLIISFIYPYIWKLGSKDGNAARFGRARADTLRGFKIGILSAAPAIIGFIALIAARRCCSGVSVDIYTYLNCQYYSLIKLVLGKASVIGDVTVLQYILLALLIFIIPAITTVSYYLGFKDILVSEKFIYKKSEEQE